MRILLLDYCSPNNNCTATRTWNKILIQSSKSSRKTIIYIIVLKNDQQHYITSILYIHSNSIGTHLAAALRDPSCKISISDNCMFQHFGCYYSSYSLYLLIKYHIVIDIPVMRSDHVTSIQNSGQSIFCISNNKICVKIISSTHSNNKTRSCTHDITLLHQFPSVPYFRAYKQKCAMFRI
jgi:hypothetical protein